MVVIIKNFSDQPIMIDDLGIEIPVNNQINLTDLFSFFEIMSSYNLKDCIMNESLIINNGEIDLNSMNGVEYITFE